MQNLDPITLNDSWHYYYSDNATAMYDVVELDHLPAIPLPKLSDWMISSSVQYGADWFWRTVDLTRWDNATQLFLKIDKVPEAVSIFVNGCEIGIVEAKRAFTADVTPFITKGRNQIVLKVAGTHCANGGRFVNIHLQPVYSGVVRAH